MPKQKFRDVYYGLKKLRDILLGRKHITHLRFAPLVAPRSIPTPDILKSAVVKYSDHYYVQRHAFDSVKPPVIAPIAAGVTSSEGKAGPVCFSCPPTPGPSWWWDGHCYYVDDGKSKCSTDAPKTEMKTCK